MDLSTLTLQQLRCVVAVERHRSFREAARACHVSQPALSAAIKKVVDALGDVAEAMIAALENALPASPRKAKGRAFRPK